MNFRKVLKARIPKKEFNKWKKKYQKKIDVLVFGSAFEDEKGKRIDPRNVFYDVGKKKYRLTSEALDRTRERIRSSGIGEEILSEDALVRWANQLNKQLLAEGKK